VRSEIAEADKNKQTRLGDKMANNRQKSYDGETLVVKDLNLDIAKGEFLTMLGPSGSGKTTCLMMLAGFEPPRTAKSGSTAPDQQRAAAQARHRHGVPELRAVPAHDGGREPGVPA
jgi:ABC-type Fe3+/spermidine/putrescine transport system ATPase subunit